MTDADGERSEVAAWRRFPLSRLDFFLALAWLVVAILARWPFIARGETLLQPDEAIVGVMAQDIDAGRRFPIYFYGQRYMGALEAYAVAGWMSILDNDVIALRLGPALFFAASVAIQSLMLSRWFGRGPSAMGCLALVATSPYLTHWSFAARGGYVEVMTTGALALWVYGEWFVANDRPPTARRLFAFGLLVGFGMWINPSFLVFAFPIIVHLLLGAPWAAVRRDPLVAATMGVLDRRLGGWLNLPIAGALGLLALTGAVSIRQEGARFAYQPLWGVVPPIVGFAILAGGIAVALAYVVRRTTLLPYLRSLLEPLAPLVFGFLIGQSLELVYMCQRFIAGEALERTLPMAPASFAQMGVNLTYLWHGAPVTLSADPRWMLALTEIRHEPVATALSPALAGLASALGVASMTLVVATAAAFVVVARGELADLFRLRSKIYSPAILLAIGLAGLVTQFFVSGFAFEFTTIRYLVPASTFVPGLLAAVAAGPTRWNVGRWAPLALVATYGAGQAIHATQLGAPHPLRGVADALPSAPCKELPLFAEPTDAHALTFLTRQNPTVREWNAWWPRLPASKLPAGDGPTAYLVPSRECDLNAGWAAAGFPGRAPSDTRWFLPRLLRALRAGDDLATVFPGFFDPKMRAEIEELRDGAKLRVLTVEPIGPLGEYEVWTLSRPLPNKRDLPP